MIFAMDVGSIEGSNGWGFVDGSWRLWRLCWLTMNCCWKGGNGGCMAATRVFNFENFLIFGFFFVGLFSGGFGINGYGYPGKLCKLHRITLIPTNGARRAEVEIDRVRNLDIVLVLDQANAIKLRPNQSVIRSHSNQTTQ